MRVGATFTSVDLTQFPLMDTHVGPSFSFQPLSSEAMNDDEEN